MKSVCEGCERNSAIQRDQVCLMDWEERLENELEAEMKELEVKPIDAARLTKVFSTTFKSTMQANKERVEEILEQLSPLSMKHL